MLDSADVFYMHAADKTLKPLGAACHGSLRLITGHSFRADHCILNEKVGWTSPTTHHDTVLCKSPFIYHQLRNIGYLTHSHLHYLRYSLYEYIYEKWIMLLTGGISFRNTLN